MTDYKYLLSESYVILAKIYNYYSEIKKKTIDYT